MTDRITAISDKGVIKMQHIAIAIVYSVGTFYVPLLVSIGWAFIFAISLVAFVNNRMGWLWCSIAVSPAFEVWARMAKASFIPYEIGKYYILFAIFLLLINQVKRQANTRLHNVGAVILALLAPSLVVALAVFDYEQWVFNTLGIVEAALLLIIVAKERLEIETFCVILQYALLSIVALVIYITIKSPTVNQADFLLSANNATSGGFGSNQVSTILGTGIVIAVLLQLLNRQLLNVSWLNFLIIGYLVVRCLLTFSRGGMVAAFIAVIIAFLPIIFSSIRSFVKYFLILSILGVGGYIVFDAVNKITGNSLLLRYKGETQGTLSGSKAKTTDVMFSGRIGIAESEIDIFKNNILFGVGPGGSKNMRNQYGYHNTASHTELTRLLSEHGLGGLLAGVLLLIFPVWWVSKLKGYKMKGIVASLFTLAILTTMHASTRTNVFVVFYVLAAMPMVFYSSHKGTNAG